MDCLGLTPKRIGLIDRQPLFLGGLGAALAAAWPGVVVDADTNLADALARMERFTFDLILCDYETLEAGGVDALPRLVQAAGATPVIALANTVVADAVQRAMAAGARGFLPKTMTGEAIRCGMSFVLAGGVCLPTVGLPCPAARVERPSHIQSRRELEILAQLARGSSNKMIARELGLSVATVKLHVQSILRATGAKNRTEAVANARRMGVMLNAA